MKSELLCPWNWSDSMHHALWAMVVPALLQVTPPKTGFTLPMEIGSIGHPIVRAKLTSRDGTLKEGRFILDTGASHTVLDRALSSQFWVLDEADDPLDRGSGGSNPPAYLGEALVRVLPFFVMGHALGFI